MNARQAKKKAQTASSNLESEIKAKAHIQKISRNAQKRAIRATKKYRREAANIYEDALRSGFMRIGVRDKASEGMNDEIGVGNKGIAASIRNNLSLIGLEQCNVKPYEDSNWYDIVVMALNRLDDSDIINSWIRSYFQIAPTYGDGVSDASGRGGYIPQPSYGREVFKLWAEIMAWEDTGVVSQSLVD